MEKLSSEHNLKQNTRRRQAAELFESINVYYKAADCFYELKEYVRAGRETKRIKVDSVMAFFALEEKVLELYTFAKIMTPNPECATVDTHIVDALHTMHDGKFLHLPVVDRDGDVVAVVDVIHITHAAVATVGNTGAMNSEAMMQKFWEQLGPADDDEDTRSSTSNLSEGSLKMASESGDTTKSYLTSSVQPSSFSFKIEDKRGRMHRFICDTQNLTDLITCILQRVGDDIDRNHLPLILYEDEDGDKVVLATDCDLAAAVDHAKLAGWRGLRLHLDYSGSRGRRRASGSTSLEYAQADAWAAAYSGVAAGAALVAGLGVLAYLKRNG